MQQRSQCINECDKSVNVNSDPLSKSLISICILDFMFNGSNYYVLYFANTAFLLGMEEYSVYVLICKFLWNIACNYINTFIVSVDTYYCSCVKQFIILIRDFKKTFLLLLVYPFQPIASSMLYTLFSHLQVNVHLI